MDGYGEAGIGSEELHRQRKLYKVESLRFSDMCKNIQSRKWWEGFWWTKLRRPHFLYSKDVNTADRKQNETPNEQTNPTSLRNNKTQTTSQQKTSKRAVGKAYPELKVGQLQEAP